MNPSTIPATCSLALTAAVAAGISHWWSVREFSTLLQEGVPVNTAPASAPADEIQAPPSLLAQKPGEHAAVQATLAANGSKGQRDFYEALIDKMSRVEAQNRDLLDQLAETNRDLMKLEFRVDTHSESFRPLPVEEDMPPISIGRGDSIPGVLPPRAEPVKLPSYE